MAEPLLQQKASTPSLDEARDLAERDLAVDPNTSKRFLLSLDVSEFGKHFGTGVGLYFELLHRVIIVFAVMSIVSVATLWLNAAYDCKVSNDPFYSFNCSAVEHTCCEGQCTQFPRTAEDTRCVMIDSQTSVPSLIETTLDRASCRSQGYGFIFPNNVFVFLSLGNKLGRPSLAQVLLDAGIVLIFVIFAILYRRNQVLTAQHIQQVRLTAADYSVWVANLPADCRNPDELRAFFAKRYGDVHSVTISFADRARWLHGRKLAELQEELEHLEAERVARPQKNTAQKIKATTEAIRLTEAALRDEDRQAAPCSSNAFVTFHTEKTASTVVGEFNQRQRWLYIFSRRKQPPLLFRDAIALRIKRAPEPSDILWENLQFGYASRVSRQILTSMLSSVLILLSTSLIVAVNSKIHFTNALELSQAASSFGFNLLTLVVILGANIALFIYFPILARRERFHLRSDLEMSLMREVVNTVLAALVVWTKNWSNWYGQSGILLFNVFVGDGILMNAIEIFRPFDVLIPRKILAKKALTQTRMNRMYQAPELSLGMRYQFVLKPIFVSMFFSSVHPFTIVMAMLILLSSYWIDKYNVLRVYRTPPNHSSKLAEIVNVYLFPWAVIFHVFPAIYLFNVQQNCPQSCVFCTDILPSPSQTLSIANIITLSLILAVYLALWIPLTYVKPDVEIDTVRAKEVLYERVQNIAKYVPPDGLRHERRTYDRAMLERSGSSAGYVGGEITYSVFD